MINPEIKEPKAVFDSIKPYLQLMRPANVITAVADILAGMSIAGFAFETNFLSIQTVVLLALSTIGLYGGGVVLNDYFDAELDAIERPERPIPSGKVHKKAAGLFGYGLLIFGIIMASLHTMYSAALALTIAVLCIVYDAWGKHQRLLGPINMGLCRGVNLVLGMSAITASIANTYWLGIVPVVYIAAITMVSRGEVHGGKAITLYFAGFLYLLVSSVQVFLAFLGKMPWLTQVLVFVHLHQVGKPLWYAIKNPIGPLIGKAVKAGVISLIIMDAAWVGLSGNLFVTLLVLALLPLSIRLAKIFAVT